MTVSRSQPITGHTPTPWRLCTTGNLGSAIEAPSGKAYYDGDDGYRIVCSYQECTASEMYVVQEANRRANGALIVEAVNSYATLKARITELEEALVRTAASLAATISLLERTPKAKMAAPSNTMFEQMLVDYRNSLEAARAALQPKAGS